MRLRHPYVPLTVLALVPMDDEQRHAILSTCCVRMGNMHEVDTQAAERSFPGSGNLMSDYFQASRELWDSLASGKTPQNAVTIERTLVADRQVDTRDARVYLTDTADLLARTNGLEAASGLLETTPAWSAIRKTGKLARRKSDSTLTMRCPARHYPDKLGGVRSRNETARFLTVTTSHAGWRDSRARRLTSVTVTAHEIWPDPTRWDTT